MRRCNAKRQKAAANSRACFGLRVDLLPALLAKINGVGELLKIRALTYAPCARVPELATIEVRSLDGGQVDGKGTVTAGCLLLDTP